MRLESMVEIGRERLLLVTFQRGLADGAPAREWLI
jgi:hypothetical protein